MAELSTSTQRRDGERGAMLDSPVVSAPRRTKEKDPPRYGAQHRQDALWEGGNEALPPQWHQYQMLDARIYYLDDTLVMISWDRPLPGVRLDDAGQLVPGCEWHISPLGRSYFVDHNTRTTSWKKPTPVHPPGSLTPECVIESHSKAIWSLVCFSTSCNILSASLDGSICQWKRDGQLVGRPWKSDGRAVCSMAISQDDSTVVSGSGDGRLRLWNIKKGSVVGNPWEGHDSSVRCLDWTANGQEVASGSEDGTIRRWNPDTGRQIAPPIEASHGIVYTVRYSPQGDKFASGAEDMAIRVWSKDGELLIEIEGHDHSVTSLCWSKDGAHIFSASCDRTIRKWRLIDGKELVVFRGHTIPIGSLCLSPDESHLVSASLDYSVRIWDLKTNQPVGNPLLHNDEVYSVVISPDGKFIISGTLDGKIYVWSLEAALNHSVNDHSAEKSDAKLKGRPVQSRDAFFQSSNRPGGLAKYGKDFWDADTNTESRSAASPASTSFAHRLRDSLRFSTRSNAPQSIPFETRHWNLNVFRGGSSVPTVEVAAGRKKNRIFVSPPSAAEVARAEAAAAAQRANANQAGSSTQVGQPQAVPVTQVSQGPTETQGAGGGTGDVSYEGVSCCGFFFGRRLPTSHQS
ncbi:WD40 repeat-like protein [Suillus brevipes Sb2]|nr:WD40 repeat-like protein [Suillus brevipes Sb2]